MRLKSHESPRRQGRNDKGKGGSARKRQLDKRFKTTVQRLQDKTGAGSETARPYSGRRPPDRSITKQPQSPTEQVPHLLFFCLSV